MIEVTGLPSGPRSLIANNGTSAKVTGWLRASSVPGPPVSTSLAYDWLGCETWGDDLWPTESPLVHFDFALPAPRARRRLRGVGDFRDVRRQLRLVWSK